MKRSAAVVLCVFALLSSIPLAYSNGTEAADCGPSCYDLGYVPSADDPANSDRRVFSYDEGFSFDKNLPVSKAMNIFKTPCKSQLDRIGFKSLDVSDADYKIEIVLGTDAMHPERGRIALTQTGHISGKGAHVIELEKTVYIAKAQIFGIRIELSGEHVSIPIDTACYTEVIPGGEKVFNDVTAQAGQSFIFEGGEWIDVSADGSTNVRIRAYTTDVHSSPMYVGGAIATAALLISLVCFSVFAGRKH